MTFVEFVNEFGKKVAINPYKISAIYRITGYDEARTQIQMDSGTHIELHYEYDEVMKLIQKAVDE